MRPTLDGLIPIAAAIKALLQCVAFAGVSLAVLVSTLRLRRSCQRHTHGFDLPVRRMISFVPQPSAVASTISARHTTLDGVLRSAIKAASRARLDGLT